MAKLGQSLVHDEPALERQIQSPINRGLFFLRYTTSDPADNVRRKEPRTAYPLKYSGEMDLS